MKELLKPFRAQRRPVATFIVGSLAILLVSLTLAALVLAGGFLNRESRRADLATRQLVAAFSVQLTELSSEMWTGNYESIALRVDEVAAHFGRVPHEVYLLNKDGACVYSNPQPCTPPKISLAQLHGDTTQENPSVVFDPYGQRYSYVVPLGVGAIMKGYLVARLGDPYDFYRGSLLTLLAWALFPILFSILVVWGLWLFVSYRFLLKPYFAEMANIERDEALMRQARQLAHDIRNPVGALEKLLAALPASSTPFIGLMRQATLQIKDIAGNLLVPSVANAGKTERRTVNLGRITHLVLSQCRVRWKGSPVRLEFSENSETLELFASLEVSTFRRALANIVDNAFEASHDQSREIRVVLAREGKFARLSIADQGMGIPEDRLARLGTPGATFGKVGGHGLGLAQARAMVEAAGGKFRLFSKPGSGTTVEFQLPLSEPPAWYISSVSIPEGGLVAVLDDDLTFHSLWQSRLASIANLRVQCFTSLRELEKFCQDETPDLLLVDYDLGSSRNGLDALSKVGLEDRAILATQLADEESIQARCAALGIKLLPKDWIEWLAVLPLPGRPTTDRKEGKS